MGKVVNIEPEWKKVLQVFFDSEKFAKLSNFIKKEYKEKKIFPKASDIFRAFWLTPFSEVKAVILGQDPYHGQGQAMGLSFSVPQGTQLPPSLQNIYKEIENDLGVKKNFSDGNLETWGKQGVLLLNAILTVVANSPASHQKRGWENFTDFVIRQISEKKENVVFILWGNHARSKKNLIDQKKHLILESVHPSPFSAYNGFFGSKPFSKCNDFLKKAGLSQIEW